VGQGGKFPPATFRELGRRADEPASEKAREAPAHLDPDQAAEELWQYVLERPDVIRQRASYAATAAAVVATGVAVVGGLTSIGRFPTWVTVPLAVTVVLWILGLGVWVWAIGGPSGPIDPYSPLPKAVKDAMANARKARRRLLWATVVTGLALLATAVGFSLAAYSSESQDDPAAAVIQLTPSAAKAAQRLCDWDTDRGQVYGEVRLVELSRPVVTIAMPGLEREQPDDHKKVVFDGPKLRLRSSSVVLASEHEIERDALEQEPCELEP
jgi:hypothetical protein